MRLEHVNLVVADIEPTLAFLQAAFPDWSVRGRGTGDWYGKPSKWVHFGNGRSYMTLNDHGEGQIRQLAGHLPGLAHMGFETGNLDELRARLSAAGFEPRMLADPDTDHRRRIYYVEPAGFEFEFVEYSSDLDVVRNEYVPVGAYESVAVV
ncbi:MAG: glyoxalase [Hirschia sp.]|nr:glyoxalase [Hirschia sp.]MBF19360.1 glyoxalase [Hirschia sp.]|tara:strand:+ start:656 stop:1108 length:453 start_codon:yes stop_codon:yes gene_type:complete